MKNLILLISLLFVVNFVSSQERTEAKRLNSSEHTEELELKKNQKVEKKEHTSIEVKATDNSNKLETYVPSSVKVNEYDVSEKRKHLELEINQNLSNVRTLLKDKKTLKFYNDELSEAINIKAKNATPNVAIADLFFENKTFKAGNIDNQELIKTKELIESVRLKLIKL